MKRFLLLIPILFAIASFTGGCKQPPTNTKVIVTVLDGLDAPVVDASVIFYVDSVKKNTILGIPDTMYTDGNGKVTKEFDNGIVIRIKAEKNGYIAKDYAALQPGDTQQKTLQLKKP